MNIYDISKRAGVSIATVSRVLNNSIHVSEKTRQHVLNVIEESGYVPNAFARGLGLNTMKTIGLLCPDASDAYLAHALSLLEHAFRVYQYDCLLVCTGRERQDLNKGIEALASRHVDGMVLMGSSFVGRNQEENRTIFDTAAVIPTVILNGSLTGRNLYSVTCDDADATRLAVEHVCLEGRTHPLYLYHALNDSGEKKLSGFRNAVQEFGLEIDASSEVMIGREKKNVPAVAQIVMECITRGMQFDSVITSEDTLAAGALKGLRAMGIRVPDQVSVIGYNNSELCLCTDPELTSIDNRLPALCEQAVQTMIGTLEGREMPLKTVFSARIIERESTRSTSLSENKEGKEF